MSARVLVVDDDLTIAEVVGDYLRGTRARTLGGQPGSRPAGTLVPGS